MILVEVLRRYSGHPTVTKRLLETHSYAQTVTIKNHRTPQPVRVPARNLLRRLPEELVEQLAADYIAGASTRQLASQYGIAKTSVIKLLEKQGVVRPRSRITDEQVAEALEHFQSGLSVKAASIKLGIATTTLASAFRRRGLPTRHS
jgi:hypothetical protein